MKYSNMALLCAFYTSAAAASSTTPGNKRHFVRGSRTNDNNNKNNRRMDAYGVQQQNVAMRPEGIIMEQAPVEYDNINMSATAAVVNELQGDLLPEGAALTMKQSVIAVPHVFKQVNVMAEEEGDDEEEEERVAHGDEDIEYIDGMAPDPSEMAGQDDGLDKCHGIMAADSPEYLECMGAVAGYSVEDGNDEVPIVPFVPETKTDTFVDTKNGKTFTFEEEDVDVMETVPDGPIPTKPDTFVDTKNGKTFTFEEEDVDVMETVPDGPIPTKPDSFVDTKNGKTFTFEEEDVDVTETVPDGPIPTKPDTFVETKVVSKTVTYEYADGTTVTETLSGNGAVDSFSVGGKTFTFEDDEED